MNQGGIPSTFPLSTLADPHVKTPFTKDDVCSLHGPGASVLLGPLQKQTRFKRTSGLQRLFRALGGGLERGGKVHGKVKTWAYFLPFLESMGVCDCVYKGTSMHASKLYLDRIFRIILFSSDRGLACSEVMNLKWIQEPLLLHRFRRNTCYGRYLWITHLGHSSNILHKLPLELGSCKAEKKASATGFGWTLGGQCESKTQQKGNGKSRGQLVSNNRARNGATFLISEGILTLILAICSALYPPRS